MLVSPVADPVTAPFSTINRQSLTEHLIRSAELLEEEARSLRLHALYQSLKHGQHTVSHCDQGGLSMRSNDRARTDLPIGRGDYVTAPPLGSEQEATQKKMLSYAFAGQVISMANNRGTARMQRALGSSARAVIAVCWNVVAAGRRVIGVGRRAVAKGCLVIVTIGCVFATGQMVAVMCFIATTASLAHSVVYLFQRFQFATDRADPVLCLNVGLTICCIPGEYLPKC